MGMDDGAATLERSDISFKQLAYEPAIPSCVCIQEKETLKATQKLAYEYL